MGFRRRAQRASESARNHAVLACLKRLERPIRRCLLWLHNPGARPVRGVAGEQDASVGGLDGAEDETEPELELVREVVAATCPLRLKVVPAGLRLSIHAQRAARRGAPRNGCRWARAF